MFLVAVVLLGALSVPLLGGRLGALADLRVRCWWALPAALALQVASIDLPGVPARLRPLLQIASYPVAGILVVANRRLPGMPLIALGGLLNLAALVANGGVMPAAPGALASAGIVPDPGRYANSAVLAHPRLALLGDLFAVPLRLPLHNVFSIGDCCIALGAVLALHGICGSRLARGRRRGASSR